MLLLDGFPELLQRPLRRGMRGDVGVLDASRAELHDEEDVEDSESNGDDGEEVCGEGRVGVVSDEGGPTL